MALETGHTDTLTDGILVAGTNKNVNNITQFFHNRDNKHEPWFNTGMTLMFYGYFLSMSYYVTTSVNNIIFFSTLLLLIL